MAVKGVKLENNECNKDWFINHFAESGANRWGIRCTKTPINQLESHNGLSLLSENRNCLLTYQNQRLKKLNVVVRNGI